MTAVDTTVSLTLAQIAALRASGVTAVSRYIAPQSWKRITPLEYGRIIAGGLQVSLNWESGAQDLKTLTVASTQMYAAQAVTQARACGYPAGCVILNSADWDVSAGDWPTVAANLRAIRPIYRAAGYGLGLYAPWDALSWALRDGLVDVYWQAGMSTGWSGGRNRDAWPGAHLRQRRSTTIAGVACDTNDILIPTFGQAGAGNTPNVSTGADMDQAEKLIRRTDFDGRVVGDVLADLENVRAFLYAVPGAAGLVNPPPAGSVADLLAKLAANPPAPTVDVDALAVKVAAALIASNTNGLTPADHAAVVEDVKAALRAGTAG
jgi:hypothetical protein